MKKRGLNAVDVLLIIIILACAAGIALRAFGLPYAKSDEPKEYRVSFYAPLTAEGAEAVNAGLKFKDEKGTEGVLSEGYWIKTEDGKTVLYGELIITGRLNESGFECGAARYYKNDRVAFTGKALTLDATITDFIEK